MRWSVGGGGPYGYMPCFSRDSSPPAEGGDAYPSDISIEVVEDYFQNYSGLEAVGVGDSTCFPQAPLIAQPFSDEPNGR